MTPLLVLLHLFSALQCLDLHQCTALFVTASERRTRPARQLPDLFIKTTVTPAGDFVMQMYKQTGRFRGPFPWDVFTKEHLMEYETAYRQHLDGLMFASDLPRPSPACLCTPTELLTEGATSESADVGDVSDIETDMPELESDKEEDLPEFPPPLYS